MKKAGVVMSLTAALLFVLAGFALPSAALNAASPAKGAPQAKSSQNHAKVHLNKATEKDLETLPRIGPKVAQRIIKYRESHKGFKSVDELRNVRGIGQKTMAKLRPLVTL
ncbi:MAG: helix-hairpin-helix domain-containing protein [Acidobacteriota bacterium]|jgi:competence protein ComEA